MYRFTKTRKPFVKGCSTQIDSTGLSSFFRFVGNLVILPFEGLLSTSVKCQLSTSLSAAHLLVLLLASILDNRTTASTSWTTALRSANGLPYCIHTSIFLLCNKEEDSIDYLKFNKWLHNIVLMEQNLSLAVLNHDPLETEAHTLLTINRFLRQLD